MTEWLSNSLILLVVALAAIWIPVSISKTGLRIYATGSDEIAAFEAASMSSSRGSSPMSLPACSAQLEAWD